MQIKFHKLNGSHIAKSTKNHSLPRLHHIPASRPGSTIADRGNPGSLAPPALVAASAPVSYLGSPDLNLASEAPGRTTPRCSQTTVRSPRMHPDSAGSALTPRRDCSAVSVPAQQLVLDSGCIADAGIADAPVRHELRHDCQQSLHNFTASYDDFAGSCL